MTESESAATLDASPTKEFFIYMLTRDLLLSRAIVDLIDNSVDGAHRHARDEDYSRFFIRVEVRPDRFKISDNCGGIPINVARRYAFRFGRPIDVITEPGTIGQFGVGMKRTIFKLGSKFYVESKTKTSFFSLREDIDEWKSREEWNFSFEQIEENRTQEGELGTVIEVSQLNETPRVSFGQENFRNALMREIEAAHALAIKKGISITLNGLPVSLRLPQFVSSPEIQPAYIERVYEINKKRPVRVRIYAGVSKDRDFSGAGWFIFCNGRLVLGADQSPKTGWGDGIRKYHADFAFFRGFVFFDSDDPELLPWTTTKTGIDEDSPTYQAVRLEMINIMRPVMDFLNRLARDKSALKDEDGGEHPLEEALRTASVINHTEVRTQQAFVVLPEPKQRPAPRLTQRIQYDQKIDLIEQVKEKLGVRSLREVGERTFDYYYEMECAE